MDMEKEREREREESLEVSTFTTLFLGNINASRHMAVAAVIFYLMNTSVDKEAESRVS